MTVDLGDWATPQLVVDPYDGTTTATLVVTRPDGTTSSPTAATGDGGATWTAPAYEYTQAGLWSEQWTVTGVGARAERRDVYIPTPAPTGPDGTVTVDPATPIGLTRLYARDTDPATPVFTDAQYQAFLDAEGGSALLAAAMALDLRASDASSVTGSGSTTKKIGTLTVTKDTGTLSASGYRALAQSLRDRADQTGAAGAIEVIDFDPTSWWSTP